MKQLAKIIPLLSSDQPGEVAAAASAIGRVLAQGGKDWHWLAQQLSGGGGSSSAFSADLGMRPGIEALLRQNALEIAEKQTAVNSLRSQVIVYKSNLASLRQELAVSHQKYATLQIEMNRLKRTTQEQPEAASPKPADPCAKPPHATVYSDGGCNSRTGIGAWACIVRYGDAEEVLSGSERNMTNNRAEMMACLAGLRHLTGVRITTHPDRPPTVPRLVHLVSDSQLLLNGIGWVDRWRARGWRINDGSSVKNRDLWEEMDAFRLRFRLSTEWVRGHSGHPENERCDAICTKLMKSVRG
jgi:ribonuclease HI